MNDRTQPQDLPTRVECPAAKDPAVRLFILAAMMLGFGIWCFIDAYLGGKYPWKDQMTLNEKLSYYFNHGGAIILPLAALVPIAWAIVILRRKVVADEEGIGYAGKDKIPWTAVTRLDTSQLADKGCLSLHYEADGPQTMDLDGYKLKNFRDLVKLIEAKVPQKDEQ